MSRWFLISFLTSTLVVQCYQENILAEDLQHIAESAQKNCSETEFCTNYDYGPHSPHVPCKYLPLDFLECEEFIDHQNNQTALALAGAGCLWFGGQKAGQTGGNYTFAHHQQQYW